MTGEPMPEAVYDMKRAVLALYLEAPALVARGMKDKWNAVVPDSTARYCWQVAEKELRAAIAQAEDPS